MKTRWFWSFNLEQSLRILSYLCPLPPSCQSLNNVNRSIFITSFSKVGFNVFLSIPSTPLTNLPLLFHPFLPSVYQGPKTPTPRAFLYVSCPSNPNPPFHPGHLSDTIAPTVRWIVPRPHTPVSTSLFRRIFCGESLVDCPTLVYCEGRFLHTRVFILFLFQETPVHDIFDYRKLVERVETDCKIYELVFWGAVWGCEDP